MFCCKSCPSETQKKDFFSFAKGIENEFKDIQNTSNIINEDKLLTLIFHGSFIFPWLNFSNDKDFATLHVPTFDENIIYKFQWS